MSMNYLILRFVSVFSMIMMMSNTALSYTGNVLIKNSLQNQKDLIVHCKSAHKDMGYHRVHPTGSYNLLYKLHYDSDFPYNENNHIWCHVWQGQGFKHHQVFNVYDGDHWEAKEDGIYHQWALMYVWDAAISKASSFGARNKKKRNPNCLASLDEQAIQGLLWNEHESDSLPSSSPTSLAP
ncbi:hypothetical protein YC2023_089480 [Brassica napus]